MERDVEKIKEKDDNEKIKWLATVISIIFVGITILLGLDVQWMLKHDLV